MDWWNRITHWQLVRGGQKKLMHNRCILRSLKTIKKHINAICNCFINILFWMEERGSDPISTISYLHSLVVMCQDWMQGQHQLQCECLHVWWGWTQETRSQGQCWISVNRCHWCHLIWDPGPLEPGHWHQRPETEVSLTLHCKPKTIL